MYNTARSLFFDLTGWLTAGFHRFRFSAQVKRQAAKREETLYQERLRRMEREYVRQAMAAYARRDRRGEI